MGLLIAVKIISVGYTAKTLRASRFQKGGTIVFNPGAWSTQSSSPTDSLVRAGPPVRETILFNTALISGSCVQRLKSSTSS